MSYSDKLKHPKWQRKRLEIMEIDDFKCCICDDGENQLHVHHIAYRGSNPWDTPSRLLVTLCDKCHKKQHGKKVEEEKTYTKEETDWAKFNAFIHLVGDRFPRIAMTLSGSRYSVKKADSGNTQHIFKITAFPQEYNDVSLNGDAIGEMLRRCFGENNTFCICNAKDNGYSNMTTVITSVIDYFNESAQKSTSSLTSTERERVRNLLKLGYKEEDFYYVIDKKVKEWKDSPKFKKYIRLKTLLGHNFEKYLNGK